jgi:hypothetical protein
MPQKLDIFSRVFNARNVSPSSQFLKNGTAPFTCGSAQLGLGLSPPLKVIVFKLLYELGVIVSHESCS